MKAELYFIYRNGGMASGNTKNQRLFYAQKYTQMKC